jgi:uncharacterized membrane protein
MSVEAVTEPRLWRKSTYASILVTTVVSVIWLLYTPEGILGKADAIGYAVCHRIDLRSFHLGVRTLPLCARCSGMYLSALVSWVFYQTRYPRHGNFPPRIISMILSVFAVIWAIDGLNSFLSLIPNAPQLYSPTNTLRLITGAMVGIGLTTILYPTFQQSIWETWDPGAVLPSVPDLIRLVFLVAGVMLAMLSGNALLLYPLALLSAATVLLILTAVYASGLATVFGRGSAARNRRELIPWLVAGAGCAVIQIGLIDLVRYLVTGTWQGFHF